MFTVCFKVIIAIILIPTIFASPLQANNLEEAQQAFDKKQYKTATIHLKNQLIEHPNHAEARHLLGMTYLQTNNMSGAEKELGKAMQLLPNNPEYTLSYARALILKQNFTAVLSQLQQPFKEPLYENKRLVYLGTAHVGLGQYVQAEQLFHEANKQADNIQALNGLALIAFKQKEFEKASKLIEETLALDPSDSDALQLKAKLAYQNRDYRQALTLYNQLLASQTNDLSLYLERALTHMALKQTVEAHADINQVLKKYPKQPHANFLLAQLLLQQKDYVGAQAAAQLTLNALPGHAQAILILATAHFSLKNYYQAEKYFTLYLFENPHNLHAQNLLANLYLAQNKIDQAILILEGVERSSSNDHIPLLVTLASAYLKKGDKEKALELLSRAQKLKPNSAEIAKRLIAAKNFTPSVTEQTIREWEAYAIEHPNDRRNQYVLIASYLQHQELDKAEQRLKLLLMQFPQDPMFKNLKAHLLLLTSQDAQAKLLFKNIIQQHPDNILARASLAQWYLTQKNSKEAEYYFKDIIAIDNKYIPAYLGLARLALEQKQPQKAEQLLLMAFNNNANHIEQQLPVAEAIARVYRQQKAPRKLLDFAGNWAVQHPNKQYVLAFLLDGQLAYNQFESAEKTLRKLIQIEEENVRYRYQLVQLLAQKKEGAKEALNILEKVIAQHPDDIKGYITKASLLIQQKNYDQAFKVTRQMDEKWPESYVSTIARGDIYRARQQYQQALNAYQKAIDTEESNDKMILALADVLVKLNKTDEAITVLKRVTDKNPDKVDLLFQLAFLYSQPHTIKQAIYYYERVLQLQPTHVDALNNLAWFYLTINKIQKALSLAQKAAHLMPDSAIAMDTYGVMLLKNQHNKTALSTLKQAAQLAPKRQNTQYHLAQAYEANNMRQQAVEILIALIKTDKPFSEQGQAKNLLDNITRSQ